MPKKQPKVLKFKPSKNKITLQDFRDTHIYGAGAKSDPFYTKVANDLYVKINDVFKTHSSLTEEYSKRAAISLAAYLEDLVSGSGVWAAFTSLHKKKYGKKLPFYEKNDFFSTTPYDDEVPSVAAIRFILWYVANDAVMPDSILNPQNPRFSMLALALEEILLTAYEDAPESPARLGILPESVMLKSAFFQIRDLCEWLCTRCYLTRAWDTEKLKSGLRSFMSQLFKTDKNEDFGVKADYGIESYLPFNALIGPLAITPQEWLAEIMELYPADDEEQYIPIVRDLISRPYQFYQYKTIEKSNAIIVNKDGEEMQLSAYTMHGEQFPELIKPGSTAFMSLVYYDGRWVMNSVGLQPLPAYIFEKSQAEYNERKITESENYNAVTKKLKKRIGVCGSYDEYMSYFHKDDSWKSKVSEKEYKGLIEAENILFFINTNGETSLLPEYGDCVKLRGNKYYDKESAEENAISLIFNHDLGTPEFRRYIVEKKLIPDAMLSSLISEKAGKKLFQDNIRFFNDYTNRNTAIIQ